MKIKCYFEVGIQTWSNIVTHNLVYDKLVKKYPDIEFEAINSQYRRLESETYSGPNCKYGPFFMIIENPDTGKYILVSYWDKLYDFYGSDWDHENCVEVLTSIGTHKTDIHYQKYTDNYTPISFVGMNVQNELYVEELYKKRLEIGEKNKSSFKDGPKNIMGRLYPDKPSFRGYTYLYREYVSNNENFNIMSDKIGEKEFLHELDDYALNYSPNGAGEVCFRDLEVLGLGTALFRPKFVVKFHNELIPDYHYISIDTDNIDIDITKPYDYYFEQMANNTIKRFNEVKDDHEYIDFVAKNGRKWYEENGTAESNSRIIANLIDLNKLKP